MQCLLKSNVHNLAAPCKGTVVLNPRHTFHGRAVCAVQRCAPARHVWAAPGPRLGRLCFFSQMIAAPRVRVRFCAGTSHAGARPHGRTSPPDEREGPRVAGFTAQQRQREADARCLRSRLPRATSACAAAHTAHDLFGGASSTRPFGPRVDVRRLARRVTLTATRVALAPPSPRHCHRARECRCVRHVRCARRAQGDDPDCEQRRPRKCDCACAISIGCQHWLGTCPAATRRRPSDGTVRVWMRSWTPPWTPSWTTLWTLRCRRVRRMCWNGTMPTASIATPNVAPVNSVVVSQL